MNSFTLVSNKVNSLNGELEVPGDKSISHRAVILSMYLKVKLLLKITYPQRIYLELLKFQEFSERIFI